MRIPCSDQYLFWYVTAAGLSGCRNTIIPVGLLLRYTRREWRDGIAYSDQPDHLVRFYDVRQPIVASILCA